MDAMWDSFYVIDDAPSSALEVYDACRRNRMNHISMVGQHSCMALDRVWLRRQFTHLFVEMTNALFDGYGVRAFGKKRIVFSHLTNDYSHPFPGVAQALGLGAGIFGVPIGWTFCFILILRARRAVGLRSSAALRLANAVEEESQLKKTRSNIEPTHSELVI
jgi:hypothetical protein